MKTSNLLVVKIVFPLLLFLFSCKEESSDSKLDTLQTEAKSLSDELMSTTSEIRNLLALLEVERPAKEYKEYVRLINVIVRHGENPKSGYVVHTINDKPRWNYVKSEIKIERNDYNLGSMWITSSTRSNFEYKKLSEFIETRSEINKTYVNIESENELLGKETYELYTDFTSVTERLENFVNSRRIEVNSSHPTIECEWTLSHGDWHLGFGNDEHGFMIAGLEITYRKSYELEYLGNIESLYSTISETHRKLWYLDKEIEKVRNEESKRFKWFYKFFE